MNMHQDVDGRWLPDEAVDPRSIKRAPAGKLRVVHIDPRDGWPSIEHDCQVLPEVRNVLGGMMTAEAETMAVFDDQGAVIPFPPT